MQQPKPTILVPIHVQALVIDEKVVQTAGPVQEAGGHGRILAGDGKWSPMRSNFRRTLKSGNSATPPPFFGAQRKYGEQATSHLIVSDEAVLPGDKDRGVYLRWVLPPRLRHGTKGLDFPVLPDQWLIVRINRRLNQKTAPQIDAWFLDGGILGAGNGADLFTADQGPEGQRRVTQSLGQVVKLTDFQPADFNGPRTKISAAGNAHTGSPTFSASLSENRNCLSWHDDLNDLCEQGRPPDDLCLTYLVSGWFHDPVDEPLARAGAQLEKHPPFILANSLQADLDQAVVSQRLRTAFLDQHMLLPPQTNITVLAQGQRWLIVGQGTGLSFLAHKQSAGIAVQADGGALAALDWSLGHLTPPDNLSQHHCLFHGMASYINYWHAPTYKGPMLGYPGAPDAHGLARQDTPPLKVGVGFSAADALVALAARTRTTGEEGAAAWKALEAVLHHQTQHLAEGWDAPAWFDEVHRHWFRPVEGGSFWSVRAKEREGAAMAIPAIKDGDASPSLTEAQRLALRDLNQQQAAWDAAVRTRQAHQQAFQAHWQRLCHAKNRAIITEEDALEALRDPIETVSSQLKELRLKIDAQVKTLTQQLARDGLHLHEGPAPRFWMPTDPVILVQNYGSRRQLQFKNPLLCRTLEQITTRCKLKRPGQADQLVPQPDSDIATLTQQLSHFSHREKPLYLLLMEALLVENATHTFATQTLPSKSGFGDQKGWQQWRKNLENTFSGNPDPNDPSLNFLDAQGQPLDPVNLAQVWGQQPWAPLFLDWEVTWRPNIKANQVKGSIPGWALKNQDYQPLNQPEGEGFTFRGRSTMTPLQAKFFNEPLTNLRNLLSPDSKETGPLDELQQQVQKILGKYLSVWDKDLKDLQEGGLIGQTLTGLHQQFLGRDLNLPRITPNPDLPWNDDAESPFTDDIAATYLQGHAGDPMPMLGPPRKRSTLPFTQLRGGALTLDALWLVDDFGQWTDLLGGASAGHSSGTLLNPHTAWPNDHQGQYLTLPPRIVQPTRLNCRFLGENDGDPLNPIRGLVFFNYLDQALNLCDGKGQLLGELAIVPGNAGKPEVRWTPLAPSQAVPSRMTGLIETLKQIHHLEPFLQLMDQAMQTIAPASRDLCGGFIGRPLALVDLQLGLELFGPEWGDPANPKDQKNTLQSVEVPVQFSALDQNQGMVGFFRGNQFDKLHATLEQAKASSFIQPPHLGDITARMGQVEELILLMDPHGAVQVHCGLLPAKDLRLPVDFVTEAFSQFELSFQTGPILLRDEKIAMPVPNQLAGQWQFTGATNPVAKTIESLDGSLTIDTTRVSAIEGRLTLRHKEELSS